MNRWCRGDWKRFSQSVLVCPFGWSILGGTGFGRSTCFFPDAISFFLACNTSMYLPSSASSLIDSRWAKRLEFSSFEEP